MLQQVEQIEEDPKSMAHQVMGYAVSPYRTCGSTVIGTRGETASGKSRRGVATPVRGRRGDATGGVR